jgi:sterol desaturase/sphingolipid hydroxylase (fatty acid hydroxylase superfamily)
MNALSFILIAALLLVLVEIAVHFAGKRRLYRFPDVASNLLTYLLYTVIGVVCFGAITGVYRFVHHNFALIELETDSALAWGLGFVLTDLCHYAFHRSAHRVNLLWGVHQPHHSSEDFNLSTALRKGIFQQLFDWPFFLPLAIAGFPLQMYLVLKSLQFVYQFWLHTQWIGKLGWIEQVLVTPSLHRVHHAQNPEYVDKNYAGVFILWDRIFDSYAEERAPVVYGITTPVRTWNPITYQFHWWARLLLDFRSSSSLVDALRAPFMPTHWRPAGLGPSHDPSHNSLGSFCKYAAAPGRALWLYALAHFVVFVGIALAPFFALEDFAAIPGGTLAAWSGLLGAAAWSWGRVVEGARFAFAADALRFALLLLLLALWLGRGTILAEPLFVVAAASANAAWLWWVLSEASAPIVELGET